MITNAGQQGDIYLKRVQFPKEELKEIPKENGKTILAYGEQTGHHHAFVADNVKLYATNNNRPANRQTRRFVTIFERPATLFHEEHGALEFAPGTYEIFQAREWTDDDEPRAVAD
jgi:hypothetical protein